MRRPPTMPRIPALAPVLEGADHIDVKVVIGAVNLRAFLAASLGYQPGWVTGLYRVSLSRPRRLCAHARYAAGEDTAWPTDDTGHCADAPGRAVPVVHRTSVGGEPLLGRRDQREEPPDGHARRHRGTIGRRTEALLCANSRPLSRLDRSCVFQRDPSFPPSRRRTYGCGRRSCATTRSGASLSHAPTRSANYTRSFAFTSRMGSITAASSGGWRHT